MAKTDPRMKVIREHIVAESTHDMAGVVGGMTADCFNDVVCVEKPFVGPKAVTERYARHWEGFPDFTVRVRRVLSVGEDVIVTENEWRGTHLGPFLGLAPTGRKVRVRAMVAWHFRGGELQGETIFFDMGSILKQIGAEVSVPAPRRPAARKRARSNGRAAAA
jgi:steroid delta-isomerase-like uncharacterized protein